MLEKEEEVMVLPCSVPAGVRKITNGSPLCSVSAEAKRRGSGFPFLLCLLETEEEC